MPRSGTRASSLEAGAGEHPHHRGRHGLDLGHARGVAEHAGLAHHRTRPQDGHRPALGRGVAVVGHIDLQIAAFQQVHVAVLVVEAHQHVAGAQLVLLQVAAELRPALGIKTGAKGVRCVQRRGGFDQLLD
jgi:hypothetical protein